MGLLQAGLGTAVSSLTEVPYFALTSIFYVGRPGSRVVRFETCPGTLSSSVYQAAQSIVAQATGGGGVGLQLTILLTFL